MSWNSEIPIYSFVVQKNIFDTFSGDNKPLFPGKLEKLCTQSDHGDCASSEYTAINVIPLPASRTASIHIYGLWTKL